MGVCLMRKKTEAKIKVMVEPIGFGFLQTMITFLKEAKASRISTRQLIAYVEAEKASRQEKVVGIKGHPKELMRCPECDAPMSLQPVNFSKGSRTGDKSKAVHSCINEDCRNQIFYNKTIKEIKINLRKHKEI